MHDGDTGGLSSSAHQTRLSFRNPSKLIRKIIYLSQFIFNLILNRLTVENRMTLSKQISVKINMNEYFPRFYFFLRLGDKNKAFTLCIESTCTVFIHQYGVEPITRHGPIHRHRIASSTYITTTIHGRYITACLTPRFPVRMLLSKTFRAGSLFLI